MIPDKLKSSFAYISLILLFVIGTSFALDRFNSIHVPSHDDTISILAATGHQKLFAVDNQLIREFTTQQDWMAFWRMDEPTTLLVIEKDLSDYDIHPPLYFWLLHYWIKLTGSDFHSYYLLNLIFAFFSMLLIFLIGQKIKLPMILSVAASASWMFSHSTLTTLANIRQYSMISFLICCIIFLLISFSKSRSWYLVISLVLTVSAGLLTHYQLAAVLFVLQVIAGVFYVLKGKYRAVAYLFFANVAALVLCFILHPHFLEALEKLSGIRSLELDKALTFSERWLAVKTVFSELFLPRRIALTIIDMLSWVLPISVLTFLGFVYWLSQKRQTLKKLSANDRAFLLVCCLMVMSFVFYSYLSGSSPSHAMGARYLAIFSPLLMLSVVVFADWLLSSFRLPKRYTILFGLLMITYMCKYADFSTRNLFVSEQEGFNLHEDIQDTDIPMFINTDKRGQLAQLMWPLNSSNQLYVESEEKLPELILKETESMEKFIIVTRRTVDMKKYLDLFPNYITKDYGDIYGRGKVSLFSKN